MLNVRAMFTVKQLSDMAGISVRTLHYYDQIGLLHPERTGENGYRYYGEASLLRLQQILFFRELDFPLAEIQALLDRPGFDMLEALAAHRVSIQRRIQRLERLVGTIDRTVSHLKGETPMSKKDYYAGFDEARQKKHEETIRQRYGDEPLNTSVKRWNDLTREEKNAFLERGNRIHQELAAQMDKGPQSPEVQALIQQFREHYNFFYDITIERFEGLGHMYNQNPDFQATYENIRPGMAAFMEEAVVYYCQQKSTAR